MSENMTTSEPTTGNVIQQVEGRPSLIEAANVARDAADAILNNVAPTTGEIVRALRCDGDANNCVDCRYATYETATILCDQEQNVRDAADRLESQEQTISALTARAERAERERDALLTDFSTIERDGLCEVCSFGDSSQISKEDCMKDCCFNYRTRRGLPQEGEGK